MEVKDELKANEAQFQTETLPKAMPLGSGGGKGARCQIS
jgi:hypothetical protein